MPPYSFLFVESMAQVMTGEPSTLFIITLRISPVSGSRDLGPESWLVSTLWLSVWVWLRPRWYQWHLTLPQCQLGTEYYILNSDLIYKSDVSWLDTDNPVFTFSSIRYQSAVSMCNLRAIHHEAKIKNANYSAIGISVMNLLQIIDQRIKRWLYLPTPRFEFQSSSCFSALSSSGSFRSIQYSVETAFIQ